MLTESYIFSTSAPPSATQTNNTLLKDAGIFLHTHQPHPRLVTTFKKSRTSPNCLAYSRTHIFAAQATSSTLHVYNIASGTQEATIPFRVRICSIVLCCADSVLVLGTDTGSILLWEIHTGRQIATPAAHLAPVTNLAVDSTSTFILSAASTIDSDVLVWSLPDLLSLSAASSLNTTAHDPTTPRHRLSSHRAPITALITGHAAASASGDIAISAAKDNTAIVWDYVSGTALRTFLLPATPLCLELDAADRAFFAGYEDGSVQLVDFYAQGGAAESVHMPSSLPIQPAASSRWAARHAGHGRDGMTEGADPGTGTGKTATQALALSYDTTTLLSGHADGTVQAWDVASGAFTKTVASYPGAPITNLSFLEPTGWPEEALRSRKRRRMNREGAFSTGTVVKPRPDLGQGGMTGEYAFHAVLERMEDEEEGNGEEGGSEVMREMQAAVFSEELLAESILDLSTWHEEDGGAVEQRLQADYMSLNGDGTSDAAAAQVQKLQREVEHLKRLQRASGEQIERLGKKLKLEKEKKVKKRWVDVDEIENEEEDDSMTDAAAVTAQSRSRAMSDDVRSKAQDDPWSGISSEEEEEQDDDEAADVVVVDGRKSGGVNDSIADRVVHDAMEEG